MRLRRSQTDQQAVLQATFSRSTPLKKGQIGLIYMIERFRGCRVDKILTPFAKPKSHVKMKTRTAIKQWLTIGIVVACFTLDTAIAAPPPQWAPLSEHGDYKLYYDQQSLTREGELVRIDTLANRENGSFMGAKSVVGSLEVLCELWKWRTANYKAYADLNASGALLFHLPVARHWSAIQAGSEKELVARKLCQGTKH